jgi:hypothetical protein
MKNDRKDLAEQEQQATAKLRAAVLREAADALLSEAMRMTGEFNDSDVLHEDGPAATVATWKRAAEKLSRMADETQPAETPWPTVTDFSIEAWECDTWVGVTYKRQTLDDARERRDSFRRRFPEARLRIVRWDETSTVVEADPEPAAGARQDGAPGYPDRPVPRNVTDVPAQGDLL